MKHKSLYASALIAIITTVNVSGQLFVNSNNEIEVLDSWQIIVDDSLSYIQGYAAILYDDELILSDNQTHKIVYLNTINGDSRSIGNKGKGPGEFDIIYDMMVNNDSLFVYDASNVRIQVFDNITGVFIESITLDKPILGFSKILLNNNRFYITGKSYDNDLFVHIFSKEGNYIDSIVEFIDFTKFFNNFSSRIQLTNVNYSLDNDHIYFVLGAPYKIKKLNRKTGQEIWEIEDEFLPNPWKDHIVIRPDSYRSKPYPTTVSTEIHNEYLVTYIINPDTEKSYLDIRYINDGSLKSRIELSNNYFIKKMQSNINDGFLTIFANNLTQDTLTIYKLNFN